MRLQQFFSELEEQQDYVVTITSKQIKTVCLSNKSTVILESNVFSTMDDETLNSCFLCGIQMAKNEAIYHETINFYVDIDGSMIKM